MSVQAVEDALWNLLTTTGTFLRQAPILEVIIQYIQDSYQNDPVRVAIEILLFLLACRYFFSKYGGQKGEKLTEKEINMLVAEWEPEPLAPRSVDIKGLSEDSAPEVSGQSNLEVVLTTGERVQNWACSNFLGLMNSVEVTEAAIATVREYGVGTCGPAGFYGSMDVHLRLEKEIARMLGTEEAIVYAQGFMAVASVIPAFCKRGDILVADTGVSFAVQSGLDISRSNVYYFAHNDMEDLERVLKDVDDEFQRKKLPLSRRFIVVEGLYAKHGDKCPLPQLMQIKRKYKYRLFVDESLSFGCLGPRGLGISDFFNIPARDIEIICGSFSNALGSSGGFCAGSHFIVDHQRLSSQAYCFSAALPALLAVSTLVNLAKIESASEPQLALRHNMSLFNAILATSKLRRFVIVGEPDSPLRFIRLLIRHEDEAHEISVMNSVVQSMRSRGYLLTRSKHVKSREKHVPPPSVKICISAGFSEEECTRFAQTLIDILNSL